MNYQFINEFRTVCGDQWKINLETSLNVPSSFLETVIPVADEYLIDIKDMNPAIYSAYTGRDNSLVLRNLRILAERGLTDKCVVRIPLIHGYNTPEDVARSESEVLALGFDRINKFHYDIDYAKRKRNLQNA